MLMKKLKLNYLFIGLLSLGLLASCGGDSEAPDNLQGDIVGTWRAQSSSFTVDGVSFRDYVKKLYADLGIPISDADLAAFTDEIESDGDNLAAVLDFNGNGTLLITADDGTTESIQWKISGNTLTIDDGNETTAFTIERLTNSELHLTTQFDEDADLGLEGSENADFRLLFTFTR